MYTQILNKNELVINAEEEKGEGRKTKQNKKRMDMVNTEKRKEKQEVQTTELPTNTPALSKVNENNREKSKSRKVNRNSAGLCTF